MTPGVRLLIADRLRRMNRWMPACIAVFAGFMWWIGPGLQNPGRTMTGSMGIVLMAGPQVMLQFIPRCLWYLPVSRRDIWRAHWLIITVGVTILMAFAKLVTSAVPPPEGTSPGLGSLLLSTVYDFAAAGFGCALVVIATRPRPSGRTPQRGWAITKATAEATLPVFGLAMFYVPSWTGVTPPAQWSELTPVSGAVLAAFVALAIATWFHVPIPATPANRLTSAAVTTSAPSGAVRDSRFTGLPRLLIREAAWVLGIAGSLALGGALIVLIMAGVAQDQGYLRQFLQDALRVADRGAVSRREIGYVAFNLLLSYALFASAMATRFPLMLRHLRTLPLGAVKLNVLLVCWPAVIWVTAWTLGTALHYVVIGHLPTRPHSLTVAALIGVCALAQAISLRLSTVTRLTNFATVAGLIPFAGLVAAPSLAILALIAAVSLTGAVALNRSALARGATYQALPLPIGPTPLR